VLAAVAGFVLSFVFGARRDCWCAGSNNGAWRAVWLANTSSGLSMNGVRAAPAGNGDPTNLLERPVFLESLRIVNHWTPKRLGQLLRLGEREGLLNHDPQAGACRLSARGKLESRRVTRNHRLWETYLLHFADVAPQHIHHNADQIEHVIEPASSTSLEECWPRAGRRRLVRNPEAADVAVRAQTDSSAASVAVRAPKPGLP
jgi:hypothetical protein